ncbi:deoxyuridine 5'-triphosphate nucleotidohydrolase-like [Ambystoma mexicanum]|uniref:deoxyuridine 5'-triphosphate nucleotidohydrolase-like n=1 Tax=Ambystoma mexicanum TaxID=8296 RepID=UPI0037E7F8FB
MVSEVGLCPTDKSLGTLKFSKRTPRASAPTIATKESIGFDLHSSAEVTIEVGECQLVSTGPIQSPPQGTYVRPASKSGLAWKYSLDVMAGVIDPDYRGDVKILMHNHGKQTYHVKIVEKIAMRLLENAICPIPKEVPEQEFTESGTVQFGEEDQPTQEAQTPQVEEAELIPDLGGAQHNGPVLSEAFSKFIPNPRA